MSAISLKSITGITSITTPAGVDNQLTLHNNNTTEAVKLDIAGNLHFHNHLNITGVSLPKIDIETFSFCFWLFISSIIPLNVLKTPLIILILSPIKNVLLSFSIE